MTMLPIAPVLLLLAALGVSPAVADSSPIDAFAPLYNNYLANGAIGVFERNTNCWAYGLNLSCAAVWNSASANHHLATLISPRHVLGSRHATPSVDSRLVFESSDGYTFTNRVVDLRVPVLSSDIIIGLLESEMPSQFHPAKILPANYADYIGTAVGLPVLAFDQEGKALVREISDMEWHFVSPERDSINVRFRSPNNEGRLALYEDLIIGDSGRPVFFVAGNDVVLLGAWWHGDAGDAPALHHYATEIQAAMDFLCPGYSLEYLDASAFTSLDRSEP